MLFARARVCVRLLRRRLTIHGPVPDAGFADLLLRCPNLENVLLDDCRDLTTITVTSDVLQTFTLPRARTLAALELNCSHLTALDISACTHLRVLKLATPALQALKMEFCPDYLFPSLPAELRARLHPSRGLRTERGGIEAAVAPRKVPAPIVTVPPVDSSDATSAAAEAVAGFGGAGGAGGEAAAEDAEALPGSTQPLAIPDELSVLDWRIARLTERLADPDLTQTTRFGVQRQLAVQKAARLREVRRLAALSQAPSSPQ